MSTLLNKISSKENLADAWKKLNKVNKSSYGIDEVTIEDFQGNLDDKLSSISKKLKDGKYKFSPTRAFVIPKSNGKRRPLQIPIISDRLVLKAIAIELDKQFKETIEKSKGVSFAYQKQLGVKDAVFKIKEHYNNGNNFVLEADLIDFFGTVDKNKLLTNQILPNIPDRSLDHLIQSALNQKIAGLEDLKPMDQELFKNLEHGIPQGNPLSPLFSNIYLSPFDFHLIDKGLKLVRYADDFVIMCKSREECEKAFFECEKTLAKLDLKIHSLKEAKKTKIIELKNESLDFLSITFDGKNLYPSLKNVKRFKDRIRVISSGKIEHDVLTLLTKVSRTLDGWLSAFYYTKVEKYDKEIDYFINRQILRTLEKYDWKFTSNVKGKLPPKYRRIGQSADCLSAKQRKKSGIPNCSDLLKQKRAKIAHKPQ